MGIVERLGSALAGGVLAAAIAMAIMFWTGFEHTSQLFEILIPCGIAGGFLVGKPLHDFL